jgi:hypothetical protein
MDGASVSGGYNARLSLATTPAMVEQVQRAAQRQMQSSGSWVRQAIMERLKKESKERAGRAITDMKAP